MKNYMNKLLGTTLTAALVGLLVLAAAAVYAADDGSTGAAAAAAPAPAANAQLIKQGEYLARAGDCYACHSTPKGKPYAGGLAIDSPIGKIYSSNITPDRQAGIGAWSFEDFDKLMRTGVTPQGYTVYPAMPYPSFSRLSVADMTALYAYFMQGVAADPAVNKKPDIRWPLSMRFPLTIWRWVFAPKPVPHPEPVQSANAADAQTLRGAYLVQGLGHCGACHTARGVGFQEKALTDSDNDSYLAGGAAIDGWSVPSLRNEHGGGLALWSTADIVAFLKTGRNGHTASFGAMNDVVAHSMQHMTENDLAGIARYLKSLPPTAGSKPAFVSDDKQAKALFAGNVDSRGAQIYLDRCAGCHRSDGKGNGKAFPALAGNAVLQTADATSAIRIVLSGGAVPATLTAPSALTMAPYADLLDDGQVADVVSFIQTGWGNRGGGTTAADVAKVRKNIVPVTGAGAASFAPGRDGVLPTPARVAAKPAVQQALQ